jgi:hypothetical protein
MKVTATSREQAGRIAAAALEFCLTVQIVDESGCEPSFAVIFDDRVVMNDEERAAVIAAGDA